eukprot:361266-Chlamydomonas_euryale.AAC.5
MLGGRHSWWAMHAWMVGDACMDGERGTHGWWMHGCRGEAHMDEGARHAWIGMAGEARTSPWPMMRQRWPAAVAASTDALPERRTPPPSSPPPSPPPPGAFGKYSQASMRLRP